VKGVCGETHVEEEGGSLVAAILAHFLTAIDKTPGEPAAFSVFRLARLRHPCPQPGAFAGNSGRWGRRPWRRWLPTMPEFYLARASIPPQNASRKS